MKNKMILALLIVVGVLFVNFAFDTVEGESSFVKDSNVSSRNIDVDNVNVMDKDDIEKVYKKYKNLVSDVLEKHQLEVKNLNEDVNDLDFVSRIVSIDIKDFKGVDNTWFGIVYDDEDNPKEISFYLDGDFDSYSTSNNGYTIKNTLIEDIGDIFFPHSKFIKDVEDFFYNVSPEPGLNTVDYFYKKGSLRIALNGDKISFKMNIYK